MHLDKVVIETGGKHRASVVWLHGLGADGHDFEPVVPQLGLEGAGVRFVFPHAPVRPVTINGGMAMRAWYDILGLDLDSRADAAGVADSVARVSQLLRAEIDAVGSEHVVIAGFSQGGAIAAHVALGTSEPLAGLMMLSTYLPLADVLAGKREQDCSLPIWMGHGSQDPVVAPFLGEAARRQLEQWGYQPEWHTYPMAHAVCPEEIRDIRIWLRERLVRG